jgi:hypothetical protein
MQVRTKARRFSNKSLSKRKFEQKASSNKSKFEQKQVWTKASSNKIKFEQKQVRTKLSLNKRKFEQKQGRFRTNVWAPEYVTRGPCRRKSIKEKNYSKKNRRRKKKKKSQGDQIGRICAFRVIVYFGHCLNTGLILWATFPL